MSVDPRIRIARPEDAQRLAELRWEFRAAEDPAVEERERFVARCRLWMEQRLRERVAGWRCWVAEPDGGIVGHLWIEIIEKLPNPVDEVERHAYLTNMFVEPDRRGIGVGTRLLEEALDWSRRHGIGSVILWPTERSRSLYRRFGFEVTGQVLELDLERDREGDGR